MYHTDTDPTKRKPLADHGKNDVAPGWLWRGGLAILSLSVLLFLGLLVATLAGMADPKPLGALIVDDQFDSAERWLLSSSDGQDIAPAIGENHFDVSVSPGSATILGISSQKIQLPGSIELTAAQLDGASDAGYGLWWGIPTDASTVLFGVNSDGYMAILSGVHGGAQPRDWQLFPHVAASGKENVFRADIDGGGQVVLRLNDEVAGRFHAESAGVISAGFFIQASSHGSALFRLVRFRVWQVNPGS